MEANRPRKRLNYILHLDNNYYRIAGNIGGHYIWRKSPKSGINNIGEILIWRLSVAVHIGKHALYDQ